MWKSHVIEPSKQPPTAPLPPKWGIFTSILVYVIIVLLGVLLAVVIRSQTEISLEQARSNYRFKSHDEAKQNAEKTNDLFQQMYQGIRTVARLPGVRLVDRYAKNFSADSRITVQEIYNNLYANVAVSELYIVPVDLEPDEIDPNTGKLQETIATFDEFIVGKNADQGVEVQEVEEVEEVEIYEYRLMKKQLAWMREHFPDESYVKGLEFPAISGPTVITCDNSRYSPSAPIDRDRSGLVYSVPFYGNDGTLKGCISAVVLIPVMREALPSDEFVLRHKKYGVLFEPMPLGHWSNSRQYVDAVEPDPSLIYSEVLPLSVVEGIGQWQIWVGFNDDRFWNRLDVRVALKIGLVGYLITALATIGMLIIAWLTIRHHRTIQTFVDRLEQQVSERTGELNRTYENLQQSNEKLQYEVDQRRQREDQLRHDTLHDALTGLPNRALLLERLDDNIKRSKRYPDHRFAVFFLDVNNFKLVNDSLGHRAGDKLLIKIGSRLRSCFRQLDTTTHVSNETIARFGGDEFVILLDGLRAFEDLPAIADRICETFLKPIDVGGRDVVASMSLGIATSENGYNDPHDILRDADTALYKAKECDTRKIVEFSGEMRQLAVNRLNVENDLRHAIERRQLRLQYQPIVSLTEGGIVGFEALVRWDHPERGVISPDEFIPIAEQAGLIVPIGDWVLQEACSQMQAWRQRGHSELFVNANISVKQIWQPGLVERLDRILEISGLPPRYLNLEITETLLMETTEEALEILRQIRQRNVGLHMDDFGTGYSSLSYLDIIPFNAIKIDRTFINALSLDRKRASTVLAIQMMAQTRSMTVIAEGIETVEQLAQIQSLDCDLGQGYYFSIPLDASAALPLLEADEHWHKSAS